MKTGTLTVKKVSSGMGGVVISFEEKGAADYRTQNFQTVRRLTPGTQVHFRNNKMLFGPV